MASRQRLSLFIVVLFTVALAVVYRNSPGTDLTSSYLGCRLFVDGETAHLYSQDPSSYNLVSDPVWGQAAAGHGFSRKAFLPPYVQTPLWGYALQPACRELNWPAFDKLFVLLVSACFGALIWLIARRWTPRLMHPAWMAVVCVLFLASDTVRYSMQLSQTHIIFLFVALVAVVWARSGSPISAGILLAIAAAIKITPGLLLIYWLITKQFRAAASFVVASAALLAVTVFVTGPQVFLAYLHSMSKVSSILLVAYNNQSFAAWWSGGSYPAAQLQAWHSFLLPSGLRTVSLILLLGSAVLGGSIDRQLARTEPVPPPYGAMFTLVGATLFTPIAWSHYFVILLVPVLLLLDEFLRRKSYWLIGMAALIVTLTLYSEIASHLVSHLGRLAAFFPVLVRNQFYAALVAMVSLAFLMTRRREGFAARAVSGSETSAA